MAFILIIPAMLLIVVHLVAASQQLYERRQAWAVAASASRVGAQADPFEVRRTNAATIDVTKAQAAVANYVTAQGYQLQLADFDLANNTLEVTVQKNIDYVFPTVLSATNGVITGRAETTLRVGVTQEGG